MSRYSGLWKIVRFNWPWYVGAAAVTAAGALWLRSGAADTWAVLVVAGLVAANLWLLLSLAVSHYVYDRSAVSRGAWLDRLDPARVRRVAVFHAGHDEASEDLARVIPQAEVQILDFYDPERNGTASLKRARASAERRDAVMASDRIPLDDATLDLGIVVFAAHEIRADADRAAFFRELGRVLAPAGRAIVVEHLRDGWNFLAYGPGAFHFLARRTWRRSFADGRLELLLERSLTPFVRVFELGRAS